MSGSKYEEDISMPSKVMANSGALKFENQFSYLMTGT